jgi:hypothetical protein
MTMKFEHDLARAVAGMSDLERSQLPFALSRTMNDAAFATRKHLVETVWPRSVTARNKRFAAAAIRVTKKANKRDLVTEIRDTLGRDAFTRQATGGTRRPVSGRTLAVPKIRRNAGGSIPKAMRPKAVLSKDGFFKNRAGTAILQRMRNGRLKVVYLLIPNASIDRRFPAEVEAERMYDSQMTDGFDRNLSVAIRTAFG